MQAIGVFVAGDAAQFIAFGSDFAVGVVGEGTRSAAGQGDLREAVGSVPLVVGDGAGFFLTGDLPAQGVVTVLALATVGQMLLQQLAEVVPAQLMTAAIGVTDFQQPALAVVAVEGGIPVRVNLLSDIALMVALIFPGGFASVHVADEPVAVFIRNGFIFWRNNGGHQTVFVVPILGNSTQRIFFSAIS